MNDTAKVALTFFGSIIFCAAVVGTVQSLLQGGQGGGPAIGGIIIGVGLGFLLIPWLPEERSVPRREAQQEQPRHINAA
jgi:membrane associated rhomboid family serine protease